MKKPLPPIAKKLLFIPPVIAGLLFLAWMIHNRNEPERASEQSAKVLESVMKTNTKIARSVTKLVKNTTETNDKLVEAIIALTDKIELLEAKLEAIENLEIPTPIVQVQAQNTKILKEVHRDGNNLITHITESEVSDDDTESDT